MQALQAVLNALIVLGLLCGVFYCMRRAIRWARRRAKNAYLVGAAMAPFIAFGEAFDPGFRIVHEAKQHKKREEDEPGDPPNVEDEDIPHHSVNKVRQRAWTRRKKELVMLARTVPRPLAVWAIAFLLGAMAILNSLIVSWLLVSDPADVAPRVRDVLAGFSVFEWISLYGLQATLLAAMLMLFCLRKSAVWLFAAYLFGGVALSTWYALSGEPFVPPVVTGFGASVALIVLAYMSRLERRGQLA